MEATSSVFDDNYMIHCYKVRLVSSSEQLRPLIGRV
jgi:hypothetical protein